MQKHTNLSDNKTQASWLQVILLNSWYTNFW